MMKKMSRLNWIQRFSICYGVIVLLAAVWALYIDLKYLNTGREHLAPDVVLAFISLPLSETISTVYDMFSSGFGEGKQIGYATACGLVQAMILFWLGSIRNRFNAK